MPRTGSLLLQGLSLALCSLLPLPPSGALPAPAAAPPAGLALGAQGESCSEVCKARGAGIVCQQHLLLPQNSDAIFVELGVTCAPLGPTAKNGTWWAADQPSYSSAKNDSNYGECLGYKGMPAATDCDAAEWAVRRVCRCGPPAPPPPPPPPSAALTFGTGLSGGSVGTAEQELFAHVLADGHVGQMNHFWSTCSPECEAGLTVRYYIDGENNASIAFKPSMAAGVGFNDDEAPWGTKWAGLGAGKGGGDAWFNNFKIPFGKSVRVTLQHDSAHFGGLYVIVRGGLDLPLVIGDVALPKAARLQLQRFQGHLEPLEWLNVASVPKGHSGQFFLSTLSVNNSNLHNGGLNFLEGCYHMYDPPEQPFPGTVISTGTEDYFDSGWYFNAGEFRMPVSGFTHLKKAENLTEWSAYRYHEMDPLRFSDGFRLAWRCGDLSAAAPNGGGKCYTETRGSPVGTPTCDHVISYGWVYVWPSDAL